MPLQVNAITEVYSTSFIEAGISFRSIIPIFSSLLLTNIFIFIYIETKLLDKGHDRDSDLEGRI